MLSRTNQFFSAAAARLCCIVAGGGNSFALQIGSIDLHFWITTVMTVRIFGERCLEMEECLRSISRIDTNPVHSCCPQVTVVAKACRETAPEATKYTEVAPNEQSEARNDLDFAELFLLCFSIVLLCFLLPGC